MPLTMSRMAPSYPDYGDAVWSVGATTDGNVDPTRSCYSNYGDWVTAWAPGDEIVPDPATAEKAPDASPWSGTSFAAPQVLAQLMFGEQLVSDVDSPTSPLRDVGGIETFCAEGLRYDPRFIYSN